LVDKVGLFEKAEERICIASDVVEVEGEDTRTPQVIEGGTG